MTIKYCYPLPQMDGSIYSLCDPKVFTTFVTYIGIWKVSISPQDLHKISFVCYAGTYQYIRMYLCLTKAPDTYKRALDMFLTKFKWKTCLVYMDDVIIYSYSIKEHINNVDEILTSLFGAVVNV